MTEERIREIIREELQEFLASDRYIFSKAVQFLDGRNVQTGLTTGTKIGTGATQKLSVYGVTPVVQASAIGAPTAASGLYSQAVAQTAVDAINNIRTALQNFGISA